ncbi:MAG: tRNA pseudouridine(55) synthase TruB [Puniceicoccales bacterium]|jgi:tRNA pseudouridine55 synthase|nr:tRNA pseudouridine(55) synthase TruB [Puniceicoccales bacterium]
MDGILLIDKDLAATSFGVLAKLRRRFGLTKVGHAGTLDPLATGLLVALLGKATKLSAALSSSDKVYDAIIRFGYSTVTDDREGVALQFGNFSTITEENIRRVLPKFLGEQLQIPPQFCAKKINGVPCYRHARRGLGISLAPNAIQIYNLRIINWSTPLLRLEISCSKGTYIRSLARDIGQRLGCPAHLHGLRRIKCGEFSIDASHKLCALLNLSPQELRATTA